MIVKVTMGSWQLAILNIALLYFFASCNSTYTSKRRGYYKVDFPEKKYVKFEQPGFPYTFEYPAYARILKDSTYFENNPDGLLIDFRAIEP